MEHHLVSQPVVCAPPLLNCAGVGSCLKALDTPPLSPLPASQRTPRKPTNPVQTAVSVSRSEAAIISFRMIKTSYQKSPSLKITSLPPAKHCSSAVRRRLWVQAGETCEAFTLDSRPVLKDKRSPWRSPHLDGVDADDEMEAMNSPISCFSPPYSPFCTEAISEAATKPSSSSYPSTMEGTLKEKRAAQFVSPKARTVPKSKTCASCKTKKTPLWRDSEDGTPYCNACGIRFKKYRFRCSTCHYIPRKDEREVSKLCSQCGGRLVQCKGTGRC